MEQNDQDNRWRDSNLLIHGTRHSIENYIYDPVYVLLWMLVMDCEEEGFTNLLPKECLEKDFSTFGGLRECFGGDLQPVYDWFVRCFFKDQPTKDQEKWCYASGKTYNVPKHLACHRGHDLAKEVQKTLISHGVSESLFKNRNDVKCLVRILEGCFPHVSEDTVELLDDLENKKAENRPG